MHDKPKMLTGLNQSGTWSVAPPFTKEHADKMTTGAVQRKGACHRIAAETGANPVGRKADSERPYLNRSCPSRICSCCRTRLR